jgi:hypothetical protein
LGFASERDAAPGGLAVLDVLKCTMPVALVIWLLLPPFLSKAASQRQLRAEVGDGFDVLTEGDVGVRGVDMILRLRPDIFAAEARVGRCPDRPINRYASVASVGTSTRTGIAARTYASCG